MSGLRMSTTPFIKEALNSFPEKVWLPGREGRGTLLQPTPGVRPGI